MFNFVRQMYRKIDKIIHPPIPDKIQYFETPEFHPTNVRAVRRQNWKRSQTNRYRRWRRVRNQMARESRRINRAA